MSNDGAVGFWSYAHEDDTLDGGNILCLSRLIMEEYNLLSGGRLNLFVDRNDLAWGQEWRARIDSFLAETTFFIPIITPRYFTRPECRRELLEFAAKARMLGAEELLLPILYIEARELSADNSDEAVALIARTQYVDWHNNRLLEIRSREYRAAVNALAQRLIHIARTVADTQLSKELNSDLEDDSVGGVLDIIARIEALLPEWQDAVWGDKSGDAQVKATWNHYREQIAKLRSRKAPQSALLSAQIRMGRDMLPLAERMQKDSQVFLARSIDLDPLVSALARLIAEHPDSFSLGASIRTAIDDAMEEIRKPERSNWDTSIQKDLQAMGHLGRVFKQCNVAFAAKTRNAREGNEIVQRWDAELIDPNRLQSEQS